MQALLYLASQVRNQFPHVRHDYFPGFIFTVGLAQSFLENTFKADFTSRAGRSDSPLVKILSLPGLYLQKLTTAEPDESQLEVAIAAMKAVMVPKDTPYYQGLCDKEGQPL